MSNTPWTPGPWRWAGEDYRGGWGWQLLVGPKGEGLIVGQSSDGTPSEHLRTHMPVAPELCVTGMYAHDKPHVNAVHVFSEANARLIAAAPEMAEVLEIMAASSAHPDGGLTLGELLQRAQKAVALSRALLARIRGDAT